MGRGGGVWLCKCRLGVRRVGLRKGKLAGERALGN